MWLQDLAEDLTVKTVRRASWPEGKILEMGRGVEEDDDGNPVYERANWAKLYENQEMTPVLLFTMFDGEDWEIVYRY